jgi:hypothetical protein
LIVFKNSSANGFECFGLRFTPVTRATHLVGDATHIKPPSTRISGGHLCRQSGVAYFWFDRFTAAPHLQMHSLPGFDTVFVAMLSPF